MPRFGSFRLKKAISKSDELCGEGLEMKIICLLLAGLSQISTSAFPQNVSNPPVPTMQFPSLLNECEGKQCTSGDEGKGTWVFHGLTGDAQWTDGAMAKLVVERFDSDGVRIRRIDLPTSSSYGLTALYTGKLKDKHVEGTVVWYWNGHWGGQNPSAPWTATVQDSSTTPNAALAVQIPLSLTECEGNQCVAGREGGCTWVFHGSEGEGRCRSGASEKLTLQQSDAENIVIRRTDLPNSNSYGLTGVYVGTLHGDRITGYATWSWPGHWENRNPSAKWFAFATPQDVSHPELPPVPPPLLSPEVHPDGRVTFRFLAPNALEVFLAMDGAKIKMMQKDEVGLWSVTTEAPLQPGSYGYQFEADDVRLIDPSNPLLMPNVKLPKSMVEIPVRPDGAKK